MKPLVSVIVPNYNHARFLEERFQSILNQKFQDFELIILDDCSTDKSVEILKKYSTHPKVSKFVINEKNSGSPFAQWEKGIKLAKGKYIWIAESDDSCMPEFLSTTVDLMERNGDLAVCYAATQAIDGKGELMDTDMNLWNKKRIQKREGKTLIHKGDDFVKKNLYWACYICNASGALIRKGNITSDMLAQSIEMRNAGDWLFWSKICKTGKVGEIYQKLNLMRLHNDNTTLVAQENGYIYSEDLKVLADIEKNNKIGLYRRIIRHGTFIKLLRRGNFDENYKKEVLERLYEATGGGFWEYRAERVHKVLWHIMPFLLTSDNDRL